MPDSCFATCMIFTSFDGRLEVKERPEYIVYCSFFEPFASALGLDPVEPWSEDVGYRTQCASDLSLIVSY
jgi:hypothetical protein